MHLAPMLEFCSICSCGHCIHDFVEESHLRAGRYAIKNITKTEKDKQIPGKGKSAIVGACCIKLAECSPIPDLPQLLVSFSAGCTRGWQSNERCFFFLWRTKNELNICSKERKLIKIAEFSSRSTEFFCNFSFFSKIFSYFFFHYRSDFQFFVLSERNLFLTDFLLCESVAIVCDLDD